MKRFLRRKVFEWLMPKLDDGLKTKNVMEVSYSVELVKIPTDIGVNPKLRLRDFDHKLGHFVEKPNTSCPIVIRSVDLNWGDDGVVRFIEQTRFPRKRIRDVSTVAAPDLSSKLIYKKLHQTGNALRRIFYIMQK